MNSASPRCDSLCRSVLRWRKGSIPPACAPWPLTRLPRARNPLELYLLHCYDAPSRGILVKDAN